MTCIDKNLQSVNHVNLLSYTKWIMRGHSYRIAYKYIGGIQSRTIILLQK